MGNWFIKSISTEVEANKQTNFEDSEKMTPKKNELTPVLDCRSPTTEIERTPIYVTRIRGSFQGDENSPTGPPSSTLRVRTMQQEIIDRKLREQNQ